MTLLPEQTVLHPIPPANVRVSGELLERLKRAANRLLYEPPYSEGYLLHSVNYAPDTWSHFADWSGDMSGRWMYALTAAQRITGEPYPKLTTIAEKLRKCQRGDGHFGKKQPISTTDRAQIYGNGWILPALTEFALSTNDEHFLQAAKQLGDYYVAVQDYWFDSSERMKLDEFYAKDFSNFLHALDGLVLLYRVTQKPQYLEISRRMADNLLSFSESDHSHNFLSTRRGLLDLYGVTGEAHYLEQAEADWQRVRTSAMISTGGIFERFKEPLRDEGCSEADWLRFNLQLWQCTGKTQYLDLAERILLNPFFYNQLSNGGFGHNIIAPLLSRDPLEAVWCCSMHGTHTLAVLPRYLVTHSESEIFIGLYAPCQVIVPWPEHVTLSVEADFPAVSKIEVTVRTTAKRDFSLNLRVPTWAVLKQVRVAGKPVEGEARDGFVRIQRSWEGETRIEMELGSGLWIEANGNPVPKSEIAPGKAWLDASLFFGPLLLTHNTESIEGVSPVLLLPVDGNGQFDSEVITCMQQRLQSRNRSPLSLYEATGAEVWGKQESIDALLTAASIAPKRLCSLNPVSEREGRFYRFPIILTDVECSSAPKGRGILDDFRKIGMEMTMNEGHYIQFLGTGAGDCLELHPPSAADAKKREDQYPGGRSVRHAPSLYIAPDMLVDFIGSAQMQAYGIPEETVRHLLITHTHEDHFQPLAILDAISGLRHPWTVYGNTTVAHAMDFASTHRWDPSEGGFEWIEHPPKIPVQAVGPGQTFSVGASKVTALSAKHMIDTDRMIQQEQVLNYVIERRGKTLFYGLDSSYMLPESMELLSAFQFDIAVFDATFGHKEIDPGKSGHQNFRMLDETIAQFREADLFKQDAVIVADHISYYEVEPYEEIVEELAEKGIVLAYDGMKLAF